MIDRAKEEFEQECANIAENGICGACMRTLVRGMCVECDSLNSPRLARPAPKSFYEFSSRRIDNSIPSNISQVQPKHKKLTNWYQANWAVGSCVTGLTNQRGN